MISAKILRAHLVPLQAERDSRLRRGVRVPKWLTQHIEGLEAQLAEEYHRTESDNQDEAEFMALQHPRRHVARSYRWYLVGAAVCLALAALVALS